MNSRIRKRISKRCGFKNWHKFKSLMNLTTLANISDTQSVSDYFYVFDWRNHPWMHSASAGIRKTDVYKSGMYFSGGNIWKVTF